MYLVEVPDAVMALVHTAFHDRPMLDDHAVLECLALGAGVIATAENGPSERSLTGGFETSRGDFFLVFIEPISEHDFKTLKHEGLGNKRSMTVPDIIKLAEEIRKEHE